MNAVPGSCSEGLQVSEVLFGFELQHGLWPFGYGKPSVKKRIGSYELTNYNRHVTHSVHFDQHHQKER